MSKGELTLFDRDFLELLTPEVLKEMMKIKLEEEHVVAKKMYGNIPLANDS